MDSQANVQLVLEVCRYVGAGHLSAFHLKYAIFLFPIFSMYLQTENLRAPESILNLSVFTSYRMIEIEYCRITESIVGFLSSIS